MMHGNTKLKYKERSLESS